MIHRMFYTINIYNAQYFNFEGEYTILWREVILEIWQALNLTLITEPNLCETTTGVNKGAYFVTCFENSS